ncbi:MAG: hypothetical protein RKO24_04250 [Candidatus Competibacter sp.]|nr:hypothetical protein [Candidatus Competibacter sp.]
MPGIPASGLRARIQNLLAEHNAFTYFPPRVEVASLQIPKVGPAFTELSRENFGIPGGSADKKIFCP